MVIPPPNVTGTTPHRPRARPHARRRARALEADAGPSGPLGARHRPRRDRDPDGRRARSSPKEGIDRQTLGREAFVERVWAWKREAKDTIQTQLRRLGCSLDWTRERFTLDAELSRAVRHVFVRLYRDGLIYRGRYVVNWCPRCGTAVSDLEVVHRDVDGKLYLIRYDVPGVSVGGRRRDDAARDDARRHRARDPPGGPSARRSCGGRRRSCPSSAGELPVVEDAILVDRAFGTGVVKVTPAHDANDFASAERHGLPAIAVIGPDGKMTRGGRAGLRRPRPLRGAQEGPRAAHGGEPARRRRGPLATRSGTASAATRSSSRISPTQWFVKIEPLAEPAIGAVEDGRSVFVPESWTKTYFEWMRNIHDWCISRQLWWGHRIPAFYCDNGHITVAEEDPAACGACGSTQARAGSRRARHVVLLAALAVLRLRLARGDRRSERRSIRPTSS